MKKQNYISITTFSEHHKVSDSFIFSLIDLQLIEIEEINAVKYIPESQLSALEKFVSLYNDLAINSEGIDVIQHLLQRIQLMKQEISLLKRRLELYES